MINYTTVKIPKKTPESITCSRCKTTFDFQDPDNDFETQEFLSYDDIAGFGSILGDGTHFRIDLCQHCFVELCGDFIEYPED